MNNSLVNLDKLMEVYGKQLGAFVISHPQEYPWHPVISVETIVARFKTAISGLGINSVSKDGHAWKATCKELGIKHTYKAIQAYLEGK